MANLHRFISISIFLTLSGIGDARAGPSPCEPPPAVAQLSLTWESGSDQSFDRERDADVAISRRHFRYLPRNDKVVTIGYGHEYSIIDTGNLPGPKPSSNGHLHTLYVPIDASRLLSDDWLLRLQPTVSISSNLLKDPARITARALQYNAALSRPIAVSPTEEWQVGICGDYRFGDYRLYPTVARLWQVDSWSIRLGFPDSTVAVRLDPGLTAGMSLSPDGNRWFVHDEDPRDSIYRYEAWRLDSYLAWRFARSWQGQLHVGFRFRSRHELVLEDATRFDSDTRAPWYFSLTLRRFLAR